MVRTIEVGERGALHVTRGVARIKGKLVNAGTMANR